MKTQAPRHAGFTLIELVLVVAVLAILASVIPTQVSHVLAKSRFRRFQSDFNAIRIAAMQYYTATNGQWAPDTWPAIGPAFVPEYLPKWPTPPCSGWTYDWDNLYTGDPTHMYTIRVTSRNSVVPNSTSNAVIFDCYVSDDPDCLATIRLGTEINLYSDKAITCQE